MLHPPPSDRYGTSFDYVPPPPAPMPSGHYPNMNGVLPDASMSSILVPPPLRHETATLGPPLPFQLPDQANSFDRSTSVQYNIPNYNNWPAAPSQQSRHSIPYQSMSSAPGGTALLESSVPGSSHFTFSNPQTGDYIADYDWLFDGTNPLLTTNMMEDFSSRSATTAHGSSIVEESHVDGFTPLNGTSSKSQGEGEEEASKDDGQERQGGEAGALHDLAFFAILQRVSVVRVEDDSYFEC
jgi:hypothetical protein